LGSRSGRCLRGPERTNRSGAWFRPCETGFESAVPARPTGNDMRAEPTGLSADARAQGRTQAAPPLRPRVLFGIGGLGTGGSEKQLIQLLCQVHGRTIDGSVVTFQQTISEEHARLLKEVGVDHYAIPRPAGNRVVRAALLAPQVFGLVRAFRPDAIYSWLEETALYLAPIAFVLRVPILVARRNVRGSRAERYLLARTAIRTAERSAALVTVNSAAGATEAEARGIKPDRIRLVRNGHEPARPLPMPDGPVVRVGCVAQFRPEKGHRRLLDALSLLSTATPWEVELAGEGPLMAELKRESTARGLADRVRFLGEVADVRAFWARQHIAILLSDTEGSPNALIEAALAGRPTVATATGGTPDVVGPGGGFLVGLDDHQGAARALSRLIDDASLRTRVGNEASRQALARFAIEDFVAGHVSAIREVVAHGS
jgi:glycosyltransferase involved in cell wall biosynthesis